MHYFKRNIGDYHKKAGRLSMLEHGAYTLLMDACYDRERFPTRDEAIDWCWARSAEEIAAVEFVLNRFFVLVDGRYTQERIAEEIESFYQKSEKNKQIALEREAKRRADRARNVHETCADGHLTTNQEPLTKNQEPKEKPLVPSGDDTAGYSAEFEACWAKYPKRAGGNSKKAAHKAWAARIREGVTAEALDAAVQAYASEMIAKGKVGTEYVKQAATFFGPNEHWREAMQPANVHPIRKGLGPDGKLLPGYFWHEADIDLPIEKRRILSDETHDRASGYRWDYLRSRGLA
ncbi:TPA: YdaU family protein [Pseudomonas aeruginosa]|uniref:YdaU family protein n=1 Tax=Pseudomonas aeruginosa TaxID=287 RepID=UPI001C8AA262|nr:YdaU family protein [Pseudomonas aeruginosa]HCG1242316.1 YdaU family protein [Pseudomonas aeruginosa]HCR1555929.1 YdaU family protein [Pseudomonas aeruginosa]HEO1752696.1 YdaU family protein [Pseudomonas aeruginosa]